MHRNLQLVAGAALLIISFCALAQKPIAYPAKGQSASQQSKDDGECLTWAQQTTGINPAAPPQAASAAPPPPRGGVAKGAAAGAVIGAVGDNNVGNAALKGAAVGGVAQHSRARGQKEAAAAQAQQQQAQTQQNLGQYYKAYGACMTGRGYTVS